MPDPLEYCNAEAQYMMLLVRYFTNYRADPFAAITYEEIDLKIRDINNVIPFMLSSAGRNKVRQAVFDFWNKGVKFGGVFEDPTYWKPLNENSPNSQS